MLYLHLLSLLSFVSIANAHLPIDGSKRYPFELFPKSINMKDANHHRSLDFEKEFNLQLSWWNWNFCTNAYPNASYTPVNSFAPDNTVFLASYPTFNIDNSSDTCRSKTVTRTGTINTGQQTIFFPVSNYPVVDVADDWQKGTCGVTLPNETDAIRLAYGVTYNDIQTNATYKEKIYLEIDGKAVTPIYLYDKAFYFLSSCGDNRTLEQYFKLLNPDDKGDSCDFDPYQTIGGTDIGPMTGYYGIDTRTWADGESHTYEFGSLNECVTAKYILTAQAPPTDDSRSSSNQGQLQFVWTWNLLSLCLVQMILWSVPTETGP
jgi:hypothetical protein